MHCPQAEDALLLKVKFFGTIFICGAYLLFPDGKFWWWPRKRMKKVFKETVLHNKNEKEVM
jgi:hypothetical protein